MSNLFTKSEKSQVPALIQSLHKRYGVSVEIVLKKNFGFSRDFLGETLVFTESFFGAKQSLAAEKKVFILLDVKRKKVSVSFYEAKFDPGKEKTFKQLMNDFTDDLSSTHIDNAITLFLFKLSGALATGV